MSSFYKMTDEHRANLERTSKEKLIEHIEVIESLLASHESVIKTIPECPLHGNTCLPNAREWIGKMKTRPSVHWRRLENEMPCLNLERVLVWKPGMEEASLGDTKVIKAASEMKELREKWFGSWHENYIWCPIPNFPEDIIMQKVSEIMRRKLDAQTIFLNQHKFDSKTHYVQIYNGKDGEDLGGFDEVWAIIPFGTILPLEQARLRGFPCASWKIDLLKKD